MNLQTVILLCGGICWRVNFVGTIDGVSDGNKSSAPQHHAYHNYDTPLIWVGGVARSGTTLMRSLLDVLHPTVRCGPETRTLIHLSSAAAAMAQRAAAGASGGFWRAGFTPAALRHAAAAFHLSVILHHGDAARMYCNKDPFLLTNMPRLTEMFRKSKFVFMIRDARAGVSSLIVNNVNVGKSFNISDPESCFNDWQKSFSRMYSGCQILGPNRCLPVYYESLVNHPESVLRDIMRFLNVSWNDQLLQHTSALGSKNSLVYPTYLASKYQVVKDIHNSSLLLWKQTFSDDVQRVAIEEVPFLKTLGYVDEYSETRSYTTLPMTDFYELKDQTIWKH